MKRNIIRIDQEKCTGCGLCVSGCPEGALQLIDGKARLVGDLLCDGLGACIGQCPEGALTVEVREAEPYDEIQALGNIIPQGPNVLAAHLKHLKDHRQEEYLRQAVTYLRENRIPFDPPADNAVAAPGGGCPGSRSMTFSSPQADGVGGPSRPSRLTHWPIQLHLISPAAPQYRDADLLIAADCVAFSHGDFHRDFLEGRALVIACPKLDARQEAYAEKLTALIEQARSVQIAIMQVPCCGGLLNQVLEAAARAGRKPPMRCIVVGLEGEILRDTSVQAGARI